MTDDDAGLIALLMEWDKLESREITPRVALHIAGHIEAMKAVIRAKDEEIEFHKERADALALQADEWEGKYLIGIAEIDRLREALTQIARLRTDLSGDFSLGSHQSDIARTALGETE